MIQPDTKTGWGAKGHWTRGRGQKSGRRLNTDKTPQADTLAVTAYKRARTVPRRWPLREASLKPYWGKPAVRNFRGGRGNEVNGLMTVCHDARKGRYIGSH